MSVVLDSSVALAWLHADEGAPGLDAIFEQVVERGAFAPDLWRLEMANALTMSVRRGRISGDNRRDFLRNLAALSIAIDEHTGDHAWAVTIDLADRYELTVYDAAYLELAQRLRLPLATLDRALARAAVAAGVQTLPQ
ncbi:MAG: type II toxin-antitoxin system VapC family toxin [Beijerinckiaceae bacterium]